ncbi:hypothetical protein [Streptomyces sp. YIM B13518]
MRHLPADPVLTPVLLPADRPGEEPRSACAGCRRELTGEARSRVGGA